jgi:hypothetical protein
VIVLTPAQVERFHARVARGEPDACWPWTGADKGGGYGAFRVGRRIERTHRIAYTLAHGAIPDGLDVCHSCDNPPCCNPRHLFAGTKADNAHDRDAKGRNIGPQLWKAKPLCARGHERTPQNTYVRKDGRRYCGACAREDQRVRYAARMAAP